MRCMGDIERLDATLAALAKENSALRLRMGQLLEVIGRGAVFELGFSSLAAYAVERCERRVRWVEGARCVARRVEMLPELRRAMASGKVSWSLGELLARVATAQDEQRWLRLAERKTVRQMRVLVAKAVAAAQEATDSESASCAPRMDHHAAPGEDGAAVDGDGDGDGSFEALEAAGEICTLTCTVDHEDAWLFEATRCLLGQLGVRGGAAQHEALLAEAQGTLLALLPRGTIDGCMPLGDARQQRWLEQLRRWRDEAEIRCEENIVGGQAARAARFVGSAGLVAIAASGGIAPLEHASCLTLDQQVRALAGAMARHELELSQLLLRFHRADGWRKLGYATEAQFARERLGQSRSSLVARRTLALRLESLPSVSAALGTAQIGVEAALQLVRIATPKTEAAWIERARKRTIKHLREEVSAALMAVRLAGEIDCLPPENDEMAAVHALEQAVVSGRLGLPANDGQAADGSGPAASPRRLLAEPGSEPRRAWCLMLASLTAWLGGGFQMSAAIPSPTAPRVCSSAGRVTLRLRMARETYTWWRGLEAQARRWLPPGMSWLRFLCLSVWQAWRHLLGTRVAYGHIYIRDRFRCTSPVCNRRDVTPHHLQFRSAGGSDDPSNLAGACTWCHLCGLHGGRIRAVGPADHIHWELGPRAAPIVIVHGRERQAA